MTRKIIVVTGLLAIAVLLGVFYLSSDRVDDDGDQPVRDLSLAVLPFEWDSDQELTSAVTKSLGADILVVRESAPVSEIPSLDELAKRLKVDVVLWGEMVHAGRFEGVNVFLYQGERNHVWSEGRPHVSFRHYRERIAQNIARAVRARLGMPSDFNAVPYPGPQALAAYLEGRAYLDRHRSEGNVEEAVIHFEAALAEFPEYAEARAGMCDALVEKSLLEGQRPILDTAKKECKRALELAPVQPEVLVAQGNLLRELGLLDEAISAFDKALKKDAWFTPAYLGMAEAHLASYRESGLQGLQGAAEQAVLRAEQAMQVDPQLWKAPYILGRVYYFTGNIEQAIDAMEEAKSLDANEQVLSELANLYAKRTGAGANFPNFPNYLRSSFSQRRSYS